jgi:7,8-dihydropterin-6-yl-methyl-4-(beta-D-ribofuranosyl)aminobenzene 5'-phosphate synthase
MPLRNSGLSKSILAEHGFSTLVTAAKGETSRSLLFDFGFSEHGAALNADTLEADLTNVEALALSHGHLDHIGGLEQLVQRVGRKGIELVLHPAAFKGPRYMKVTEEVKIYLPSLSRETIQAAGVRLKESKEPYPLLDGSILFLGEIPRTTDFEKGTPNLCYEENKEEKKDLMDDDTAIVAHVKGRGLVILSGCAHSGIINTIQYAREVTGVDAIFVVMGGFHLAGPGFDPIVEATIAALKEINPEYVVPTHCTGRNAVMQIEKQLPDKFLLNMAGTKMIFSA